MQTQLLKAAVGLAFGSVLMAQTTWTVPSGTPLGPTIAAAAPGDIIQLSGTHPGFDLTKGLTIRGPATIRMASAIPSTATTRVNVPVGQTASFQRGRSPATRQAAE